jgi:ABC-type phosphate/phosphonate transport system substrate-binding protein
MPKPEVAMRIASLPMYNLAEMKEANLAFWIALRRRLGNRGVNVEDVVFLPDSPAIPEDSGPEQFFTQMCGFPLFKRHRGEYRMLASPVYDFDGCDRATHRAFFMVRAAEPAKGLIDMQGRIFGCNSLHSNSGMNLPRLEIAKLAAERPFFSAVKITGAHATSLDWLADGRIDLCSVDCVTWGLIRRYRPDAANCFRILAHTTSSPTLPFVTSARTPEPISVQMKLALQDMIDDPAMLGTKQALGLTGLLASDLAEYEGIAGFERQAERLGYAEIR